ncbi:CarD family transcriptional regulator [Clostridioides difficile]|uniref:CarD family transcriptional regulator n=1 Tax=Clostridioides difficile TaxID=1496 RepID=UPI00094451CC|nr:CarD family transcriptional regulator [Clostridioides difficile]MDO0132417.1 CarD family transcriptional regulator [Clostridioides difficile]HBF0312688.1 CarD family transcriptional regulator [Clostridioides difficile]
MYKIGENVMYPKEGACYVSDIVTKEINHQEQKYYELIVIFNSSLKISIPVKNANKVGVRRVINEGEINKLIQEIDKSNDIWVLDRKERFKLYDKKLKSGNIFEIIRLIKMLEIQNSAKKLCSTDKAFLVKAQKFALSELAATQCKSYESVLKEMSEHILN